MIRAVIFDFGGVICLHPADQRVARAAEDCGLSPEEFTRAFWIPRQDYDAGRIEPNEFWWAVFAAAGKEFDESKLDLLIQHEVKFWDHFDARMLAWVDQLRAAGIRTGILSNLPRVLGEELRRAPGLLEHFDHVTFSYELKSVKPEPAIYQDAIHGLQVEPTEALFLDDKQPNVEGATQAGLRAELYKDWEAFLAEGVAQRYQLPAPTPERRQ